MDQYKQVFRRKWWLLLAYALVLLIPVLVEQTGEFLGVRECEDIPLTVRLLHQRLCTVGYFKPRVHLTRLITLSNKSEPIQDKCEGREFVANLLLRLRDIEPAVVVIDKWYSPGVCKDSPGTTTLKSAVLQLSEKVPIVLGEDSDTLDELRANADPDLGKLLQDGFTEKDQLASEPHLVPENGKKISYGLVRLNCDTRRIPLEWQVYRDAESVRQRHRVSLPSLSFAAATVADKDVAKNVRAFLNEGEHPQTSFLTDDNFKPVHAMQIVCGTVPVNPQAWRECSPATEDEFDVKNKVVVIGEYSSVDEHRTVIGQVPGVVVQANYVEALLGDRYFKSIPRPLEITLTVLSFVLIRFIFEGSKSANVGLLYAVLLAFSLWMVSYLAIFQWGYIMTFWILSPLAIPLAYIDALRDRLREKKGVPQ